MTASNDALTTLDLGDLKSAYRGKVREIFDLGDRLLIVATDRLSAYDSILPTGIPGKGKVLNQLSTYWFECLTGVVPHHMISSDVKDLPPEFQPHADILEGRSMLVKKAKRVDIECVVRGYIAGSAWEEYEEKGTVCGEPLYDGLIESDELSSPIFTPATKADTGHDENIPFARMRELVGADLADKLRALSLALYKNVAEYAFGRGLLIADTKLEFGLIGDEIVLIDEVFTPDSSRFWSRDAYEPGKSQKSFDKQVVRDYLTKVLKWDRNPPAPALPDEIVQKTRERYEETYRLLVDRANPPRFAEPGRWKK